MALNNDQVIQHILNNPQLDEGQKLELLNNLPPPASGNSLPKGTGSFLSTEDIKPTQQAASQQEEGSGVGGSFLRGILKAPGQLIAPGLQASESILQKLGIIDPPAPGEQTEAEAAPNLLVPDSLKPPTGMAGRIAERIGEEVGAMTPFMRVSKGATAMGKAGELARQTGVAGAMGTGAGVAREVVPDSLPAEIAGQLSGLLAAKTGGMASRLFPSTREAAAAEQVRRMLGEQIGSPSKSEAEIQKALALGRDFPGFAPPLGTASQDPGLMAIERQARVTSPQTEVKIQEQLGKSREALRTGLKSLDEQGPSSPAAVESAAQESTRNFEFRARQLQEQSSQRLAAIVRDYDQRVASLNPLTRETAGEQVRTSLRVAREQTRQTADEMYAATRTAEEKPALPGPLMQQIRAIREEINPAELPGPGGVSSSFPQDVVSHIERLVGDGRTPRTQPMTFRTLRGLRSTLGYAIDAEEAKLAPDRTLLGRLSRLQASVEESLDATLRTAPYTEAERTSLAAANRFYREEYIAKFYHDPVAKLWRAGSHGEDPRMKASQVVNTFFHSGVGAAEDARALQVALGPQQSLPAFRQAAIADLHERVADMNGQLNPQRFASWVRQYRPALQVYPEVWREVNSLQRAQATIDTLDEAVKALPRAMRAPVEVESEGARLLLGKPVDTAVKAALQDAHPHERIQEMMRLTGNDPVASMGLRRQVWKELTGRMRLDAPADALWSEHAQPVAQIIKQYRPLLEQLYPPEHLKTLEKLAVGEAILDRAPQAVKMANAEIMRKSGIGGFIGTFWSRMFGVARGVVGEPFLMTEGLSRGMMKALEGISQEKQREILEHAILDPDLTKTLTSLVNGTKAETVNQRLHQWVGRTSKYGVTLGLENRDGNVRGTVPAQEAVVSPGTVTPKEDVPAKISKAATAKGLPADLAIAVAKVESGLDQSKVGTKDDVGLFQLTPIGAKDVGLGLSDRYDMDKNIDGGTSLLGKMMKRYHGDTAKALAAYNAGPTAVDSGRIPASTNAYIAEVMKTWRAEKNDKERR